MNNIYQRVKQITPLLKRSIGAVAFLLAATPAMAQEAGDIISGQVTDEFGPVMMANVVEIDGANRTVVHVQTDMNGNFSFKIKNPKDRIRISYVGYKTQTLPIKGTVYNVAMTNETVLAGVTVTSKGRAQGSGLAVPTREISTARQTISTKEFEGLAVTTIDEALQGRIAGLDIVANSGNLGAGSTMMLRGPGSFNGNDPLIVVDGNPMEPPQGFDFNSANDEKFAELLNVNPEDIESITVLKDASATAIWGSKGAGGVIEIKTKRGQRGKAKVQYRFTLKGTYQPKGMTLLNGDQYTMLMKEEFFNREFDDAASSNIPEINYKDPATFSEANMYNKNTDWVDAVKQVGWEQSHNVAIQGGGEAATFRISAGYDNQTASVIGQKLQRLTSRVQLDYKLDERIKVQTNIAFTYTDNKQNAGDLLGIAYRRMPNLAIYDENGDYYHILPTISQQLRDQSDYNPVALAYLAKNETSSYSIKPEFILNYDLLGTQEEKSRLTYQGQVLFDINNRYNDKFIPQELNTKGYNDKSVNQTTNDVNKSLNISTRHTLTFVPYFRNQDHSLMMLLRAELASGTWTSQNTVLYGLPSGTIMSTAVPGGISTLKTDDGQSRSMRMIFQAHYAFKGRYIFDVTVNRTGSTKFGPNQRWGTFPGASVKWIVSDEPWFKKPTEKWLSMFAIRAGWGIVGREPNNEYTFFSLYGGSGSYMGENGSEQKNIQLKNLKWAQSNEVNIGVDLGFLNDKITADFNYYNRTTKDDLRGGFKIPTSSGFSELTWANCGTMRNRGWDFNINGNSIIKAGKFSVDVNVTFNNNQNRILEMDETVLAAMNQPFNRQNGSYLTRVEVNRPYGSIYGFRYKGVYQYSEYSPTEVPGVSGPNAPVARDASGNVIVDNARRTIPMSFCFGTTSEYYFRGGDAMYEDVNYDGQINELDIVYIGSSIPKLTGGFGFKLKYGNWSLNNQFNFRQGNKVINSARLNAESMRGTYNQSAAVNWRWRVEGDITQIPRALYNSGYNTLGSDRFVEDGSFLRLNYTQLSYSFPKKMVNKWGLSQLSFYVTASNLFCITKYSGADPEVGYGGTGLSYDGGQTPRAKSFTGGVTVAF